MGVFPFPFYIYQKDYKNYQEITNIVQGDNTRLLNKLTILIIWSAMSLKLTVTIYITSCQYLGASVEQYEKLFRIKHGGKRV